MRKPFSARADLGDGLPLRSGRTRRILASAAASAVLLGGGTALGVAMTGGANAATSGTPASTSAAVRSATSPPPDARCGKIAARFRQAGHSTAARRLSLLCHSPLLRLALVGGEYGKVTFKAKPGTKTLAFERGTLEAVSSSEVTVMAADGTTWTWHLTSATVVRSQRQKVSSAQLSKGEHVLVAGPIVNGASDARVIRIRPAS